VLDQNLDNTTADGKQPSGTPTKTPMVNAQHGFKPKVSRSARRVDRPMDGRSAVCSLLNRLTKSFSPGVLDGDTCTGLQSCNPYARYSFCYRVHKYFTGFHFAVFSGFLREDAHVRSVTLS
jgi:hypothetical protein